MAMPPVVIENARIIKRNFAGREGQYNREGDRNFLVLIDEKTAEAMQEDGWNIKWLKSNEEGEPDQPILSVSVSYKGRPPTIVMITSRGRTKITEDEVELLDWADISNVDLILNPYEWAVSGKSGIKAYLKSMYVTIVEDALEIKYGDIDEIPARSGRIDE